ncbi:MAG: aminoacyl-tRNA hydrolase [Candidatus Coatesbacteria bacterium]|nr:MAG: aminoacyl-tRNA hydrolase [Candidatus Coatesbacteria bacterium]
MFLVVGLGNPGRKYRATRHNVGYRIADVFCKRNRIRTWRGRFDSKYGAGTIAGVRCAVIKPRTYMNRSGYAVGAAVEKLDIPPNRVIVISDDIDLPVGRVRVRRSGSSGGHKGLGSIIDELGTESFPRVRVGVGDPGGSDPAEYVLAPFSEDEEDIMADAIAHSAEAVEAIIAGGIERAMAEFNA